METDDRPITTYEPSVSHLNGDSFQEHDRRSFFTLRSTGIKDATHGDYDVRVVHAKPGPPGATGWHYHTCAIQVVYCVQGWEELDFEDGTSARLVPGSCINIPPGCVHREVAYSEDLEVIVFTSPAQIGTTNVAGPAIAEPAS